MYSNGKITSPVSIYDIQMALGESSADLGTLCRSPKINKWSFCKPMQVITNANTFDNTSASAFGNPPYGLSKDANQNYTYVRPALNEQWLRIASFNGYDHYAECPIDDMQEMDVDAHLAGTAQETVLYAPFRVGVDFPIRSFLRISNNALGQEPQDNWYMGYYFEDANDPTVNAIGYSEQVTYASGCTYFETNGYPPQITKIPASMLDRNRVVNAYFALIRHSNISDDYELYCPDMQYGILQLNIMFGSWNVGLLRVTEAPTMNQQITELDPTAQAQFNREQMTYTPVVRLESTNQYVPFDTEYVTIKMLFDGNSPSGEKHTDGDIALGDFKTINNMIADAHLDTYICIPSGDGSGYINDETGWIKVFAIFRGVSVKLFEGYWVGFENRWGLCEYRQPSPV